MAGGGRPGGPGALGSERQSLQLEGHLAALSSPCSRPRGPALVPGLGWGVSLMGGALLSSQDHEDCTGPGSEQGPPLPAHPRGGPLALRLPVKRAVCQCQRVDPTVTLRGSARGLVPDACHGEGAASPPQPAQWTPLQTSAEGQTEHVAGVAFLGSKVCQPWVKPSSVEQWAPCHHAGPRETRPPEEIPPSPPYSRLRERPEGPAGRGLAHPSACWRQARLCPPGVCAAQRRPLCRRKCSCSIVQT